jgi:hypothetical protein
MAPDDGGVREIGDHIHVTCQRPRHYGWYAVVTTVHITRLSVVFDDGLPGQFVDRSRASHAPPFHARHRAARYPRAQRSKTVETPAANNATHQERVRIIIDSDTPHHGPINIVIDSSMETVAVDDDVTDLSRTLERLAFTAAAIILSETDSTEQTDSRLLD